MEHRLARDQPPCKVDTRHSRPWLFHIILQTTRQSDPDYGWRQHGPWQRRVLFWPMWWVPLCHNVWTSNYSGMFNDTKLRPCTDVVSVFGTVVHRLDFRTFRAYNGDVAVVACEPVEGTP